MIQTGTTLRNCVTGDQVTFLQTAAETQGALLRVVWLLRPGSGAPSHWHPALAEAITVLAGQLHATIDGRPHIFGPGAHVQLPPGTIHRLRNIAAVDLVFVAEVRPAGQHQDLYVFQTYLAQQRRSTRRGFPRHPLAAALLWELMEGYVVGIPLAAQAAALRPLAWLARRLGYPTRAYAALG
jgi:quercetin dioxygenase-like cupin family protein